MFLHLGVHRDAPSDTDLTDGDFQDKSGSTSSKSVNLMYLDVKCYKSDYIIIYIYIYD